MANISTVRGTFVFDFSNVTQGELEYNSWLKKVKEALGDRPYPTNLDLYRDLYNQDKKNAKVPFTADGAWTYQSNINEMLSKQDSFYELLKDMVGLSITINYLDYEQSDGFISNGDAVISNNNGEITFTIETETDEFNKENFLNYGCGDIYTWCELTGEAPDDFE